MKVKELLEKVNSEVFYKGFERSKPFGEYELVAKAGYIEYSKVKKFKSTQFRIEALKGGSMVGWVNFENVDGHLEAIDLSVDAKHRRKGIATAMYEFARELGNDVEPSSKQTSMGKEFWTKDHRK